MAQSSKSKTFINPAGFIEQKLCGAQTPASTKTAVNNLVKLTRRLKKERKTVLILVDLSEVPRANMSNEMRSAHLAMLKAMKEEKYQRIAVYGQPSLQIVVNTLALIAGKRQKIRVFSERVEALKWLKSPG